MFLTELSPPLWDDLVMPGDDMNEHQNGGALAVISNTLGELKSQLSSVVSDQTTLREYMIRFDEKQRGWATKHEVGEITISLRSDMSKVEAKAERALTRSDENSAALSVIGNSMEALRVEVSGVRSDLATRTAEVRGASTVIRPTLAWAGTVAALFLAGVLGHLIK